MEISLNSFRLSTRWKHWLARLPDWCEQSGGIWSDGWSSVQLTNLKSDVSYGFNRFVHDLSSRLNKSHRVELTPSGLKVEFRDNDIAPRIPTGKSLFMNHVGVNVACLDEELKWFESQLGHRCVLARERVWEPVSQSYVNDAHLFRHPWYYITLREGAVGTGLDHIGWMANTTQLVDDLAGVANSMGYKIVFGPASIDGSYLFHFVGPDDRIHDVFFPTPELTAEAMHL